MTRQQETTNCCCFVGDRPHRADELIPSIASSSLYCAPKSGADATGTNIHSRIAEKWAVAHNFSAIPELAAYFVYCKKNPPACPIRPELMLIRDWRRAPNTRTRRRIPAGRPIAAGE